MKIYNLFNYLASGLDKDKYSNAILQFKKGRSIFVREIVKCSRIFARKNMDSYDYIIRALGSKEIESLGNKPLDYLCFQLADVLCAEYLKNFFAKSHKLSALKNINNKVERLEHLSNAYYIQNTNEVDLNRKKILLIDDIYTTGATIESMEKIIMKRFPDCIIEAFVIGRTVHEVIQIDNINNLLQINIEDDYYDNDDYGPLWGKEGYLKIGFLKSKHEIFPQEWDCDFIEHKKNGENELYVKIMLEESKELFLITLSRLKALFWETDFFVQVGESYGINTGKYYIGVIKRDPYLINKDYKELFSEMIAAK